MTVTTTSGREREVREDRGSRRRRGSKRNIRANGGTRQPGGAPVDQLLERGDASVRLMHMPPDQALPQVDFLAGLSEQEDTANFPMYS